MKSEIDVNGESPPTGQWTRAPGARGRMNRIEAAAAPRRNKEKRTEAQPHAAIRVTDRYDVPPARAFDAWLDPEVARRWLFATASQPIAQVEIDGRAGGSFRFVDRHAGETIEYTGRYVEIVPERRLAFTLSMEPHPGFWYDKHRVRPRQPSAPRRRGRDL